MEPTALMGSALPRGPRGGPSSSHHTALSSSSSRMSFCHVTLDQNNRPKPALTKRNSIFFANRKQITKDPIAVMSASQMESDDVQTADAEIFDPLGLAAGLSSTGTLLIVMDNVVLAEICNTRCQMLIRPCCKDSSGFHQNLVILMVSMQL